METFKNEILELANTTFLTNPEIAKIVGCSLRTVSKYVGGYTNRCKEKSLDNAEDFKIQKTVLLPDIHYPFYEERVMDAIDEFIIDYEPDELVYMGDQLSLDCISGWNKRKPLLKEGHRLIEDYDEFNEHILVNHENITNPDTRRVFMIGNHEQRIEWYCEEHPELKGMIDFQRHLKLEERGYKIIPFNEIYKIGKLNIIHGFYWTKFHAAKTLDSFEGNVVYAHVHNPQMYAKVTPVDIKGYHSATALGCICNIKPDYKKNVPNFWQNGFGIIEHLPASGFFNLYPITIVEGSFMFNGKYYGKEF